MRAIGRSSTIAAVVGLVLTLGVWDAHAQFDKRWITIGDFQSDYNNIGAAGGGAPTGNEGWFYPAIRHRSGHVRTEGFWIGAKDWTDENGQNWPYMTNRIGPGASDVEVVAFPVSHKMVSKWERSEVNVDGVSSFNKVVVVDEVDPTLPADRMVETVWNMALGITVTQKAYAYSNAHHDEYHILDWVFTNTGNVDDDPEIELPNQTLKDVFFNWFQRWRVAEMGSWVGDGGQVWGKYNMIDVVGDGHTDYPVDFTAYYVWHGNEPGSDFDILGSPLVSTDYGGSRIADGDTVGRLSSGDFDGDMILYAPNSTKDPTYDKLVQPYTIAFLDNDDKLGTPGSSHREYYEEGILGRETQTRTPSLSPYRWWPHYADRVEPSGKFWEPTNDASSGRQGGNSPMISYGPYEMEPGESVRIILARGVGALSFDAQLKIGRAYKLGGLDDSMVIEYDANNDGQINTTPFDYSVYLNGSEALTKNQWVMTVRDSLFKMFYMARDLYEASNDFTQYPIQEPPRPPRQFDVFGRPGAIELEWQPIEGGPTRTGWEVYRTYKASSWSPNIDAIRTGGTVVRRYEDSLPYTCLAGARPDCLSDALPASATSYNDTNASRGLDYYYYVVAVGENQPVDPMAIAGTPGGEPLRSSRYFAQTYSAVNLKREPFGKTGTIEDARVVPNPVNLASDQSIRFSKEDEIAFFNIPGQCTIRIYTETGELIQTIEHVDGSGDEKWNLTTRARQLLASGIYVAVIETPEGERVFRKFTVIR